MAVGTPLIGVNMVNNESGRVAWHKGGGAVRTNNGSAYRAEKAQEDLPKAEILPWFVGMVVIFAASAVCWALIYAVFMSSYRFLSGH